MVSRQLESVEAAKEDIRRAWEARAEHLEVSCEWSLPNTSDLALLKVFQPPFSTAGNKSRSTDRMISISRITRPRRKEHEYYKRPTTAHNFSISLWI